MYSFGARDGMLAGTSGNRQDNGGRESGSTALSDTSMEVGNLSDYTEETMSAESSFEMPNVQLSIMEDKLDELCTLMTSQCRMLSEIKTELQSRKAACSSHDTQTELENLAAGNSNVNRNNEVGEISSVKNNQTELMDALELKCSSTKKIQESLSVFLRSKELRSELASVMATLVREEVAALRGSTSYGQQSHNSLEAEDALLEMEDMCLHVFCEMCSSSRRLRHALSRSRIMPPYPSALLRNTRSNEEGSSVNETKVSHHQVMEPILVAPLMYSGISSSTPMVEDNTPLENRSPETDENFSAIDKQIFIAEIEQLIANGDVNGAFWRALCAQRAWALRAVLRAVSPEAVFPGRRLQPPVLLSLAQQLATDMANDTALKCRFLIDALQNLNPEDRNTRAHIPLVVGEVLKNLNRFRDIYPTQAAFYQTTMITDAANTLLQQCNKLNNPLFY